MLPKGLEDKLNPYVFLLEILVAKWVRFALAHLYLGSIYAQQDWYEWISLEQWVDIMPSRTQSLGADLKASLNIVLLKVDMEPPLEAALLEAVLYPPLKVLLIFKSFYCFLENPLLE